MATKQKTKDKKEEQVQDVKLVKKEDVGYILDEPIEEGKHSFNDYKDIYTGKDKSLVEDVVIIGTTSRPITAEENKELAYNNMVRCIRIQMRMEDTKVMHREAVEKAILFVNNQLK